jgi:hypothetical protein
MMTANDDAEKLARLKYQLDKLGYRVIPKAETNLWSITVRFSNDEKPDRLIVFIRDNNYQVVDAKKL